MMRRNIAGRSGVILDVCGEHGLWFDCDELSHLIAWIRNGGLESVKADVGRFKGSPDSIHKRRPGEKEPRQTPPPIVGGSYGTGGWGEEMRDPFATVTLGEISASLLLEAGQVVATLFGHRH